MGIMKDMPFSQIPDRVETIKYLEDLNERNQETPFAVLDANYVEQLRATLNYAPRWHSELSINFCDCKCTDDSPIPVPIPVPAPSGDGINWWDISPAFIGSYENIHTDTYIKECMTGYVGTSVEYTHRKIYEGVSTLSQQDANEQAYKSSVNDYDNFIAEAKREGQNYANLNGKCNRLPEEYQTHFFTALANKRVTSDDIGNWVEGKNFNNWYAYTEAGRYTFNDPSKTKLSVSQPSAIIHTDLKEVVKFIYGKSIPLYEKYASHALKFIEGEQRTMRTKGADSYSAIGLVTNVSFKGLKVTLYYVDSSSRKYDFEKLYYHIPSLEEILNDANDFIEGMYQEIERLTNKLNEELSYNYSLRGGEYVPFNFGLESSSSKISGFVPNNLHVDTKGEFRIRMLPIFYMEGMSLDKETVMETWDTKFNGDLGNGSAIVFTSMTPEWLDTTQVLTVFTAHQSIANGATFNLPQSNVLSSNYVEGD